MPEFPEFVGETYSVLYAPRDDDNRILSTCSMNFAVEVEVCGIGRSTGEGNCKHLLGENDGSRVIDGDGVNGVDGVDVTAEKRGGGEQGYLLC